MRNVLIHGIDSVLGSHVAAHCLATPGDRVFYFFRTKEEIGSAAEGDLVNHIAGLIAATGNACDLQETQQRLGRITGDPAIGTSGNEFSIRIDEAWYFADSDNRITAEVFDKALTGSVAMGCKEFNWVVFDVAPLRTAKGPDEQEHGRDILSDDDVARLCGARGLRYRIFQTSMILGLGNPAFEYGGSILPKFLSMLHSFKTEIEEHSPQYFDFKALRCMAPADGFLNVISASVASELLVRLARSGATRNSSFAITSPQNTAFSDLCEHIGIACSFSLLPAKDAGALNAVDRSFDQRLKEERCTIAGGAQECNAEVYEIANVPQENAKISEESWIAFFESVWKHHDQRLAGYRQRVAGIPGRLQRKTVARDQSELEYFTGGEGGPVVVVLNALGQGLECWYRLLDALMPDHRVIIWEPRGIVAPPPPFGINCQVEDLDAVLRQEGVESCHLVGWCTGPKVAIDFYLRRPSLVQSMVFLNGTLKCDGSAEELNSAYERNLDTLCRMVVRKPVMAASVKNTLQSREEKSETEILEDPDQEEMSVNILSLMNADLKSHVLAPFRSTETTINYAHQMVDFWAHDARAKATQVQVPTLLISAEYDAVATLDAANAIAALLPKVRHVSVKGATHYCLYDRPKFIAGLLRAFFADSVLAAIEEPSPTADTQPSTQALVSVAS